MATNRRDWLYSLKLSKLPGFSPDFIHPAHYLVAGTIANTNGLLVILAKLVARGIFATTSAAWTLSPSRTIRWAWVGMR